MNALLIGYGHPLRSDDRIGQVLAEGLGAGMVTITSTQLTPELAEPISRARHVVFLDARVGDTPGEIVAESVVPLEAHAAFVHHVTPSSLLSLTESLYGASPPALLISITAGSFAFGTTFSPEIAVQLPHIFRRVESIISTFIHEDTAPIH